MIDVIGHIKIQEQYPERVKALIACIRSIMTLKDHCHFILNLESPSQKLQDMVKAELEFFGSDPRNGMPHFELTTSKTGESYGRIYCGLLAKTDNKICCNFIEDTFLVIDRWEEFMEIIATMQAYNVDVVHSSFHQIEKNSSRTIQMIKRGDVAQKHSGDVIFLHGQENHTEYCKFYEVRNHLGVNWITTKLFAFKFWNRHYEPKGDSRPHLWEEKYYKEEFKHIAMIPAKEIFASIDDDHGEVGTSLLKRQDKKFWEIYNDVKI